MPTRRASGSDRVPATHPHPIQVVAQRTGLTQDVLRAWEKRYAAVSPMRTSGGRRFYSDEDLARLQLLHDATRAGRRISEIATRSVEELSDLVEADHRAAASAATTQGSRGAEARSAYSQAIREALEAVEQLDAVGLDTVLTRASLRWSATVMFEHVAAPMMREVGDRWMRGELEIFHEHFATAVVRRRLAEMAALGASESDPRILVATPSGQHHEIGALLAAATAVGDGWSATYLGADVPAEDVARAADQCQASAVALGLTYPLADDAVSVELRRLRASLSPSVVMVAGGAATASYAEVLSEIGAITILNLSEFRGLLRRTRD